MMLCRNEVTAREGIDTHTWRQALIKPPPRRNEVTAREGIDTQSPASYGMPFSS